MNLLTGAGVVSVDVPREKQFRQRDAIIARLKELERTGRTKEIPNIFTANKDDDEVKALTRGLKAK